MSTTRGLLLVLAACGPNGGPSAGTGTEAMDPPMFVGEISILEPDVAGIGLVRRLVASTDLPASLRVELDDGERVRTWTFPEATEHDHLVLGLHADRTYAVQLVAVGAGGETSLPLGPLKSDPLPAVFPEIEVLTSVPDRREPGLLLFDIKVPNSPEEMLLALDSDNLPAWYFRNPSGFGDVRMGDDGTIWALMNGDAVNFDLFGRERRAYTHEPTEAHHVQMLHSLHHEFFPLADGDFFSLDRTSRYIDMYPTDYSLLHYSSTTLEVDRIVHVGADGSDVAIYDLSEILDPGRIGFDSLNLTSRGEEWSHANAVIEDPTDGGIVVSVRHQDAVVKFDRTGALQWILGHPGGWQAPWSDALLQPVGDVEWAWHQHSPAWTADGALVVLDNGNHRYPPYDEPPTEWVDDYSRVLAYHIDEAAGTVSQAWTWQPEDRLYVPAQGDADPLPVTGQVLVAFGFLDGELETVNADLGYGRKSTHMIVFDPDSGETTLDIRLRSNVDDQPEGWKNYRAEWVQSLYGRDSEVSVQ